MRKVVLFFLVVLSCSSRNGGEPITKTFFEQGKNIAPLQDKSINEASGVAASRKHIGMIWTHNDSGDKPRLFLLDTAGQTRMVVHLYGARNRDWEDMAVGPGPDSSQHYVYVGEIGDNLAVNRIKVIYRFPEPEITANEVVITKLDSIRFVYPDGNRDAETLLVDPLSLDIYILSKREKNLHLYRLAYPQPVTEIITAELLTDRLTFNSLGEERGYNPRYYNQIVSGDISPDGKEILIKDYSSVYYWQRDSSQSVLEVMLTKPYLLPYVPEARGEAIAFAADGSGYYTLSEVADGKIPYLIFYRRKK
mgnify:CR=1 FL=1|jgi:hypothetical protein